MTEQLPWLSKMNSETWEVLDYDREKLKTQKPSEWQYAIPNKRTYPWMWMARKIAGETSEHLISCLYQNKKPSKLANTWKADLLLENNYLIEVKSSSGLKVVIARPQLHNLFNFKSSYAIVFYETESKDWITKEYNLALKNGFKENDYIKDSINFKKIYIIPREIIDEWWENTPKTIKVIRPSDWSKETINQRFSPTDAKKIFEKYKWLDKHHFSFIDQWHNIDIQIIWENPLE